MTQTELWHNKLGHPSYLILLKTAKATMGIPWKELTENDLFCEACIASKLIRNQLKLNIHRVKYPLDRICVDIMAVIFVNYNNYKYITGYTNDKTLLKNIILTIKKMIFSGI